MPAWNSRQMPHPLLAPWSDDYDEGSRFAATVPSAVLTSNVNVNLHIQYELTSPTLVDLIDRGKAQFVALVACAHTFTRESHPTEYPEQHLVLNASDYADTLLFTPHVCAAADIASFKSLEHSPEYASVRPQGFQISPATILAIGDTTAIALESSGNPYSIIDLVADQSTSVGRFDLALGEDRIKIHLSPTDRDAIDVYRSRGEHSAELVSLVASVYLHAVTEAIRTLPEKPTKQWHKTIRWALAKHGIQNSDEELKREAWRHAQTITGNPLGNLLTVFAKRDDED